LEIPQRDHSSDDVSPSYAEVCADNNRLSERIAELEALLQALEIEVEKLRRERGRHSGNSGKPPSSDTLAQRNEQKDWRKSRQERRSEARARLKELTAGTKRRPGKQPGEPGKTLGQTDDPQFTEVHVPEICEGCGAGLARARITGTEIRQVFELPTRRLEVTEHRSEQRTCACGHTTKAPFPTEAKAPTCYDPLVRAVAVYLMIGQHIPVARTARLLSEVLGAPVSTGWLAGLADEAAQGLGGFMTFVKSELISADTMHADETGARVSGASYWFHVACTDLLTLLDCHEKRGVDAFSDIGVLPFFSGVLVTDGWKPYWRIGAFDHALCLAHLLRDLASVSEVWGGGSWADDMADLLVDAKYAIDDAISNGADGISANALKGLRTRYTKVLKWGFSDIPEYHSPGSANREAYNLLVRLENQRDEVTRYWSDARVDATNNQAERDLRMVKLQRKISGCFRTVAGAKAFCTVRSYIHTAQKHGLGHLDVLVQLFKGEPWMPPPLGSSP
jgi:transposase